MYECTYHHRNSSKRMYCKLELELELELGGFADTRNNPITYDAAIFGGFCWSPQQGGPRAGRHMHVSILTGHFAMAQETRTKKKEAITQLTQCGSCQNDKFDSYYSTRVLFTTVWCVCGWCMVWVGGLGMRCLVMGVKRAGAAFIERMGDPCCQSDDDMKFLSPRTGQGPLFLSSSLPSFIINVLFLYYRSVQVCMLYVSRYWVLE